MMMHLDRYLRGQYSGKMALSKVLLLFGNGVYTKGKNLLPFGSKFFPFGVEPFLKGVNAPESKQEVTKVFSLI